MEPAGTIELLLYRKLSTIRESSNDLEKIGNALKSADSRWLDDGPMSLTHFSAHNFLQQQNITLLTSVSSFRQADGALIRPT
jgi:hypothetical protein